MKITKLYTYWRWFEHKPGGRWLFNRLVRLINPYTGALKASVCELKPGYSRLELKDRRAIRNHLRSIHAIALTNLGEFTSGLALLTLFTENVRGIPVDIHIEFLKKARGRLTAECTTQLPAFETETLHEVSTDIKDEAGDSVARVKVKWKLGYTQE